MIMLYIFYVAYYPFSNQIYILGVASDSRRKLRLLMQYLTTFPFFPLIKVQDNNDSLFRQL